MTPEQKLLVNEDQALRPGAALGAAFDIADAEIEREEAEAEAQKAREDAEAEKFQALSQLTLMRRTAWGVFWLGVGYGAAIVAVISGLLAWMLM